MRKYLWEGLLTRALPVTLMVALTPVLASCIEEAKWTWTGGTASGDVVADAIATDGTGEPSPADSTGLDIPQPTDARDTIEGKDIADTADPTDALDTIEGEDIADTVDPTDAVDIIAGKDTADPWDSIDTVEPADTADSAEGTDITDAVEPPDALDTVDPDDAVEPADISDTAEPADTADTVMPPDAADTVMPPDATDTIEPDACVASCAGKDCGEDGCGGACGECAGGTLCEGAWTCQESVCVFAGPPDCDDGNPCTSDECIGGGVGCSYTPSAGPCDDGDGCTEGDQCSGGDCAAGTAIDCNDGNSCTDDSCDAQTGCVHTTNTAPCQSGLGVCVAGACCVPDCAGKVCGDDGCDGSCGACAGALQCVEGACVGCGDGVCDAANGELCTNCPADCGCTAGTTCDPGGSCVCVIDCDGKECGADGCGGTCGVCGAGDVCTAGGQCQCPSAVTCVDGCCPLATDTCDLSGLCCDPLAGCDGKDCGSDGCGGTCGACGDADECTAGLCQPLCGNGNCAADETCDTCPADCGTCSDGDCCLPLGEPGCGDDEIRACVCAADASCCQTGWDQACADLVEGLGCAVCVPCEAGCGALESCYEALDGCVADVVAVPAGVFWMGCNAALDAECRADEFPYHKVYLPGYSIDSTEVTNAQYAYYLTALEKKGAGNSCAAGGVAQECVDADSVWVGVEQVGNAWAPVAGLEQLPVGEVSWAGAADYCEWAGKTLCTEAQFEKAARGGCELYDDCEAESWPFPWGPVSVPASYGYYINSNSGCGGGPGGFGMCPVGSIEPHSPYGAYHLGGNAWEWTADWHAADYYCNGPAALCESEFQCDFCQATDPAYQSPIWLSPEGPPNGVYRVVRGGGYSSTTENQRVSFREIAHWSSTSYGQGFRCCGACVPSCNGKLCGDDGCGGSCGDCQAPAACNENFVCAEQVAATGLTWISIPGGTFTMGCVPADGICAADESPPHEVTLSPFQMLETEVTEAQYDAVIGGAPSCDAGGGGGPDSPVECVLRADAEAFCAAAGGRLPTEAEWEYAARAGTNTIWICGDDPACLPAVAWFGTTGDDHKYDVRGKDPNGWGLYDMTGNVLEWVRDWYQLDYYDVSPPNNPVGPSTGDDGVRRGGAFGLASPSQNQRLSNRSLKTSYLSDEFTGFRCVRGDCGDGACEAATGEFCYTCPADCGCAEGHACDVTGSCI